MVFCASPVLTREGTKLRYKKFRFSSEKIAELLKLKWWDWSEEKVKENMDFLCSK
jgi:hypothetical protein